MAVKSIVVLGGGVTFLTVASELLGKVAFAYCCSSKRHRLAVSQALFKWGSTRSIPVHIGCTRNVIPPLLVCSRICVVETSFAANGTG